MAFLQFITGNRVEEIIELNPSATLVLGSSADSHIQLDDSEISPTHCQVYPAEGNFWLQDLGSGITILNMRRLSGETDTLRPQDVFIIGRTFVKFLAERPAGPAGSGGGDEGAAPEEVEKLREEIDMLWARNKKGEELSEGLSEKLGEAKERMEKARRRVKERDDEIHDLRQQRGLMDKRMTEMQKDLAKTEKALEGLRKTADVSEEKIRSLQTQAAGRDSELEQTRTGQKTARVDARRLKLEMGILENQSKEQIEKAKHETETKIGEVRAVLASTLASLAVTREALEAVGVQAPQSDLGPGQAPELAGLLQKVPPAERKQLEEELSGHIDRESLRRFAGPHVKWIRPEDAIRRSNDLVMQRVRAESVDLALSMDIDP